MLIPVPEAAPHVDGFRSRFTPAHVLGLPPHVTLLYPFVESTELRSNIVDAGYPYGSIQVPGGVEPIILHRDAVSGGGYAMIATVISADMDTVGQSAPGSTTRFVAVDLDAALAARHERREREDRLRAALA